MICELCLEEINENGVCCCPSDTTIRCMTDEQVYLEETGAHYGVEE
jgi:hypothetical protein